MQAKRDLGILAKWDLWPVWVGGCLYPDTGHAHVLCGLHCQTAGASVLTFS